MAEVYWDLEWTLQQQGFDYTYDKRLYDRLHEAHARPVREHFHADPGYQNKLARFLENHDEPRAAATFPPDVHQAAAIITFLSPGLRFFHQGQFEGRRKRISPHLVRAPVEAPDPQLQHFYDRLLAVLRQPVVREGEWQLLECVPAWEGNWTSDCRRAVAYVLRRLKGVSMVNRRTLNGAMAYGVLSLNAILLGGCEGLAVHDVSSLLVPEFQRSEVIGFVAGLGTTFAAVPDLIGMFRRRSSKGINPTMAGIIGVFQIVWIYYGLLIGSRPVIAWNTIGVVINLLTVAAYRRFARREDRATV